MTARDLSEARWADVPLALAELHRGLPVGAVLRVRFPIPDGVAPSLGSLVDGAGFSVLASPGDEPLQDLERLRTLPDVVGPGMRALICGLNPSLLSAERGFGYAGATNRFWNAALSSGLVRVARRPVEALRLDRVGMSDVVKRPTARSHQLDSGEYGAGMIRLEQLVAWLEPAAVVFVGLEGWRAARDRKAVPGWQGTGVGGRPAYVMPSTSGANARTSLPTLVTHLQSALAGPG